MDGVPPRKHARVTHHEYGSIPFQRSMGVVVQMNNIGLEPVTQIEQPLSCRVNVLPRLFHPFELVSALEDLQPRKLRLPALFAR